jgi:hypothetical protein
VEDDADVRNKRLSVVEVQSEAGHGAIAGDCYDLVTKFWNCFSKFLEKLGRDWERSDRGESRSKPSETHRIIEKFLDSRVDVFALFLSYQQVDVFNSGTRSQQLVNENLSHEALKEIVSGFSHETSARPNQLTCSARYEYVCSIVEILNDRAIQ